MKIPLVKSKNGIEVWYDSKSSHAATHMNDTPNLESLVKEVIVNTNITEPFMLFHVDVGKVIGLSDLVVNEPGDEIVYAKRLNRDEYTVFNKSRFPRPSSEVSVALEKRDDGSYELVSAWIGSSDSPSFPGTEKEVAESKDYWMKHSLAWGNQKVQPDTETSISPWQ